MEMYERIRILRKDNLKMSMEAFGKRLGVSRDVINNIEHNRLAKPEQKLSLIKLMCKEFSVNENWIVNGEEPMFIQPDTFSLDEFVKQHNGTELEIDIMKTYFSLPDDIRKMVIEHFKSHLNISNREFPAQTVEEAEAEYIKSCSGSARRKDSAASNSTDDTDDDKKVSNI